MLSRQIYIYIYIYIYIDIYIYIFYTSRDEPAAPPLASSKNDSLDLTVRLRRPTLCHTHPDQLLPHSISPVPYTCHVMKPVVLPLAPSTKLLT